MPLLDLPSELLLMIAEELGDTKSILAFALTCESLYPPLLNYLYSFDAKHGSSALLWAADKGQLSQLLKSIRMRADLNVRRPRARTVLFWAVESSRPWSTKLVERLLKKRANPNVVDIDGKTPLHLRIGHNPLKVKLLLEHGADPNYVDSWGKSPLHIAVSARNVSMIELLMKHGANPLAKGRRETSPLFDAARCYNENILSHLISKGVNLDATNSGGQTLLHVAVEARNQMAVQALLAKGAKVDSVDSKSRTALHLAANSRCEEIARALLNHGANPEARDIDGRTPLHFTASPNRKGPHRLNLSGDWEKSYEPEPPGAAAFKNMTLAKLILEGVTDPAPKDHRGTTPMHFAASFGNTSLVRHCLIWAQIVIVGMPVEGPRYT